jgi:hypothetical protein
MPHPEHNSTHRNATDFDTPQREMRSTDSRLDELETQVAWLTEQVQARLLSAVPTKMVLSVPELAARWGRSDETIRRMIRRGELRTVRGHRPYEIALSEVYRFEGGQNAPAGRKEAVAS